MYKKYFKRWLSLIGAVLGLLLIGWLILIVWLLLHFANKGAGAFFLQERPGKEGTVYKVIKFKTMTDERDADGKLLPDAMRLTKVGKIVRTVFMWVGIGMILIGILVGTLVGFLW